MLWVEALTRKSDIFGAFQRFKAAAENESGKHIQQRLRSDNDGEYTSHEFRDVLAKHGIHHEMPPPYSPQANGVAELINWTIVEGLISLLKRLEHPKPSGRRRFSPLFLSRTGCRMLHSPEASRSPSGVGNLYGSTCFECGVVVLTTPSPTVV